MPGEVSQEAHSPHPFQKLQIFYNSLTKLNILEVQWRSDSHDRSSTAFQNYAIPLQTLHITRSIWESRARLGACAVLQVKGCQFTNSLLHLSLSYLNSIICYTPTKSTVTISHYIWCFLHLLLCHSFNANTDISQHGSKTIIFD